jgi:hypothetical protein
VETIHADLFLSSVAYPRGMTYGSLSSFNIRYRRATPLHAGQTLLPTHANMTPPANLAAISRARAADIDDLNAIVDVTNRAFVCERFCVTGDRTDAADVRHRFAAGMF